MEKALLTPEEIALARYCLQFAQEHGAQKVRITLTKSLLNLIGLLNGEVDKVSHAMDRSLQLSLFVNGRFGSFSSNRLDREGLENFILSAIETVGMLEADSCRDLPAPERQARDAQAGNELGLYDAACEGLDAVKRRDSFRRGRVFRQCLRQPYPGQPGPVCPSQRNLVRDRL